MIFGVPWYMYLFIVLAFVVVLFGAAKKSQTAAVLGTIACVALLIVISVVEWAPDRTTLDALKPWDAGRVYATADYVTEKFPGKKVVFLTESNMLGGEENPLRLQISELERMLKERGMQFLGYAELGQQEEASNITAVERVLAPYGKDVDLIVNFGAIPTQSFTPGQDALSIFADPAGKTAVFQYFQTGFSKKTEPLLEQGKIAAVIVYRTGRDVLQNKAEDPREAFQARCQILDKDNFADYKRAHPKRF